MTSAICQTAGDVWFELTEAEKKEDTKAYNKYKPLLVHCII